MTTEGHEMTAAENGNWYMVNRDGMATLCADRTDAEKEAADAQSVWPHMGPHRAVQLVEASFEAADMATAAAQGFRDGVASVAASAGELTPAHIKAMERAWQWMENQADGQSKGGHATFDLMMLREERDALRAAIDVAAPPTAQAEGWTKLPGQLPVPGMPVLLDIGKKYPIRAMWAAKHTVQAADDDTDWGEYVEADDMYYAPEGWYEWNQCEDNHWRVTETPRAWMPLPPKSAEGVEHG